MGTRRDGRWRRLVRGPSASAVAVLVVAAAVALGAGAAVAPVEARTGRPCGPATGAVRFGGHAAPDDAKTYRMLPFDVQAGTTRIQVTYDWSDLIGSLPLPGNPVTGLLASTFDLGLWDADGRHAPDGFRGWSGSRGGRVAAGQDPVFVQPDVAARGYRPGPIEPGTWWVDLGIAAVAPTGADWEVTVRCTAPDVGPPFRPRPVDPARVVRDEPGWYHGDFHAHGFHSSWSAPPWDDIVDQARDAGLDFLPVTDYVTGQHWDELGPVQERNPDVLLWPGREIITYFGHAIALGETRSVLEYRHGFEGVSLADIQDATLADGALFGVAHPTIFPEPLFTNFCRGCQFTLGGVIDWSRVDTVELVTGPVLTGVSELGAPSLPVLSDVRIANPFTLSAIELWEDLLDRGHRITAVSGSDSKATDAPADRARRGIGSTATAVWADQLSRPALEDAVRAGRAYVRTMGVRGSPEIDVRAVGPDGTAYGIGDDVPAGLVRLEIEVRGGRGQTLQLHRNGEPLGPARQVTADPYRVTVPVARHRAGEGPLGTYVWVEVAAPVTLPGGIELPDLGLSLPPELDVLSAPTVITNPVFLVDEGTGGAGGGDPDDDDGAGGAGGTAGGRSELPATGTGGAPLAVGAVALVAAVGLLGGLRRRCSTAPTAPGRRPDRTPAPGQMV